ATENAQRVFVYSKEIVQGDAVKGNIVAGWFAQAAAIDKGLELAPTQAGSAESGSDFAFLAGLGQCAEHREPAPPADALFEQLSNRRRKSVPDFGWHSQLQGALGIGLNERGKRLMAAFC